MKYILTTFLGFLFVLGSVQSLGLRAGQNLVNFEGEAPDIFGGASIRKIEVRSPVSGILSKVNVRTTGYHSAGTAFVVTAESSQYYKSTVNTGGKNVSVKRVVEGGRNVYIQIFRDFFATYYTNKSVGENVTQYDLLAIIYVMRTKQGEAPVVHKLPRSVPTLPIKDPFASTSTVDMETVDVSTLDIATEEKPVEDIQTRESEPLAEKEVEDAGEAGAPEGEPVLAEEGIADKAESTLEDLKSIPEKTPSTDISDEEGNANNDFSELSEFASDSEDSKAASSSRRSSSMEDPNSIVSSESGSTVSIVETSVGASDGENAEEIKVISEKSSASSSDTDKGEAVESETKVVEVSEINPRTLAVSEESQNVENAAPVTESTPSSQEPESESPSPEAEPLETSPVESPAEPDSPIESPADLESTPVSEPVPEPESGAEPKTESVATTLETIESEPISTSGTEPGRELEAELAPEPESVPGPETAEPEQMAPDLIPERGQDQDLPTKQPVSPSDESKEDLEEPDSYPSESDAQSSREEASLYSAGRLIGSDLENSGSVTGL
ncbi:hypothetical protein HWI79_1587 [Cryptosporidium felis]|nr:hypothetical protein HWI79_1587 [Cryptosporidium felis]